MRFKGLARKDGWVNIGNTVHMLAVASGTITPEEQPRLHNINVWQQDPLTEALLGLKKE